MIDPMTAATRLVRELNREALSALVDFVDASRDGSLTLRRESGEVVVDTHAARSARTTVN